MREIRNVLFVGASCLPGIRNYGDLILMGIAKEWTREVFPDANLITLNYSGIFSLGHLEKKQVASSDIVILNGGGYLGEKPFRSSSRIKTLLMKYIWGLRNGSLYARAGSLAQRARKPLFITGVEVGPISNPFFRARVREMFSYAFFASVRNQESADFLREIGITSSKVMCAPDSALASTRPDGKQMRSKERSCFKIGLHIHRLSSDSEAESIMKLASLVAMEAECDIEYFYIHDQTKSGDHPERSRNAEASLRKLIPGIKQISFKTSVEEFEKSLCDLDFVITRKLHCGIVSRAFGIPVISIPTHTKTPRFYRSVSESYRCGSIESFLNGGLPEEIKREIGLVKMGNLIPLKSDTFDRISSLKMEFQRNLRKLQD